jgi:hypothetical protein
MFVPCHFLVCGSGRLVLLVYCFLGSSRENSSQSVRCSCVSQTVSTARSCLLHSVALCVRLGCFSAEVTSHHSSVLPAHEFACSVFDFLVHLGALVSPCEFLWSPIAGSGLTSSLVVCSKCAGDFTALARFHPVSNFAFRLCTESLGS